MFYHVKNLVYQVYKGKKLDYNIVHIINVLKIGKGHEKQCMIQQSKWQNDF